MRHLFTAVALAVGLTAATAVPAGAVTYSPPYWGTPVLHQNDACISYSWSTPCVRWVRLNGDFRQGSWSQWKGERALANICTVWIQDPGTGAWTAEFAHDHNGAQPDGLNNGFCTYDNGTGPWAIRGNDIFYTYVRNY